MVTIAGHKINNWWLIGGSVGVVGVIYFYNKGNANSAANSTAASNSGTDPVTNLPYSEDSQIDPLTGMTYLSEAQQYGSVSAAESSVSSNSGYTLGGSDYGYSGTAGYAYPTTNVTSGTGGTFATNAQWAQSVTTGLAGLGYSTEDVAAALGLYFQGHPLGNAPDGVSYQSIIQAAVAEFGPPPVGNYSIIGSPTTGTAPKTGAPDTVTVPNVVGDTQANAFSAIQAAGLHPSGQTAIKGKTLTVTAQSPKSGAKADKGSTVQLTSKVETSK